MAEGDIIPVCSKCGRPNPAQNRFCGSCGAPLAIVSSAASPVPPAAPEPAAPAPSPVAIVASPEIAPVITSEETVVAKREPDELAALIAAKAATQKPRKSVQPTPASGAVRNLPPAAPLPKASPKPVQMITPPADPIARERERERMITQANAFRAKGQVTDARETLQKTIPFFEGRPPQEIAPIHEQIGDLLDIEEFGDQAMAEYETAFDLDPKRVSADRKRAALALSLANRRNPNMISEALLKGEDLSSILGEGGGPLTRRNAGLAMFLSVVFPGFGQIYNAQVIKGGVLMAIAIVSLFVVSGASDRDTLFHYIKGLFALRPVTATPSLTTSFFALSYFVSWVYSIVDAPFFAGKAGGSAVPRHDVDKSGWEV
jgi:hypothetical protein